MKRGDGIYYDKAWWYASGRLDERDDLGSQDREAAWGHDAEERFATQYEQLRSDYHAANVNGCPSMRLAWRLFRDTGDVVTAWQAENQRYSVA